MAQVLELDDFKVSFNQNSPRILLFCYSMTQRKLIHCHQTEYCGEKQRKKEKKSTTPCTFTEAQLYPLTPTESSAGRQGMEFVIIT